MLKKLSLFHRLLYNIVIQYQASYYSKKNFSPENKIPKKISQLSGIVSVAGSDEFSIYLDQEGNVFTCGNNNYGQLGLGDTNQRNTPTKKVRSQIITP